PTSLHRCFLVWTLVWLITAFVYYGTSGPSIYLLPRTYLPTLYPPSSSIQTHTIHSSHSPTYSVCLQALTTRQPVALFDRIGRSLQLELRGWS
ncbi:hypothetical protein BO70DRAFT_325594, partial [Aspergillus heteromorphus CBS 117.55]